MFRTPWRRRAVYSVFGIGTVYTTDRLFNASAITRNVRTLYTCAAITVDYKLNFTAEKSQQIPELHARVADRIYNLLTRNGGLYIKIGQAIGSNAAFLPPAIQKQFARLFDDAPQVPYETVVQVFEKELGRPPKGPNGIFEDFEEKAVASASIGQVHRAKLWPKDAEGGDDNRWVAVKIQKPAVRKQMEWDLGTYKMVMWMFENWAFDLPVYFAVDFISNHLRQELDFVNEAQNAKRTIEFLSRQSQSTQLLSENVYIPKVYDQFTTKRVLTMEWIDGIRLSDRDGVRRVMGDLPPIPRTSGNQSTPGYMDGVVLKGGMKAVMGIMVELFSAQMFSWGWVHCDPHPGNVIIRPHPKNPSRPQLVLLDHGLYVQVTDKFRHQWSSLWKALLSTDVPVIQATAREWGMGHTDLFASATLMRPVRLTKPPPGQPAISEMTQYEQSVRMKAALKKFLVDTDRMPKELIFLMRNMRLVQANNQSFGSPVNRVKITGFWAARSLLDQTTPTNPELSLRKHPFRLSAIRYAWGQYYSYFMFRVTMISLDILFWTTKVKQWVYGRLSRIGFRLSYLGFEDELENGVRGFMKGSFGVEVNSAQLRG